MGSRITTFFEDSAKTNALYPRTKTSAISDGSGNSLDTVLQGKQESLVSGTNIKTINNTSILGSGNITVSGEPAAYIKNAAVSGKTLTLTKKDNSTVVYDGTDEALESAKTNNGIGWVEGESATLTWDGDPTGHTVISLEELDEGLIACKMSSSTPVADSLIGATVAVSIGGETEELVITEEYISEPSEDAYIAGEGVLVVLKDNTTVFGIEIQEKGIYFLASQEEGVSVFYISRLTYIDGELHRIDSKFIPQDEVLKSAKEFGGIGYYEDSTLETIYWDGDTTGKTQAGNYYRVSDAVINSYEKIYGQWCYLSAGDVRSFQIKFCDVSEGHHFYLKNKFVCTLDDGYIVDGITFPTAGVYFYKDPSAEDVYLEELYYIDSEESLPLWKINDAFIYPATTAGDENSVLKIDSDGKIDWAKITEIHSFSIQGLRTRGDVNGDGRIDDVDARLLKEHMLGQRTLVGSQLWCADMDGNGTISVTDRAIMTDCINSGNFSTAAMADYNNSWTYDSANSNYYIDIPIPGVTASTSGIVLVHIDDDRYIKLSASVSAGNLRLISEITSFYGGYGNLLVSSSNTNWDLSVIQNVDKKPVELNSIKLTGTSGTLTDEQISLVKKDCVLQDDEDFYYTKGYKDSSTEIVFYSFIPNSSTILSKQIVVDLSNGGWELTVVSISLSGKEDTANKVTSISASSTNTQYPSALAVHNAINNKTSLTATGTVSGVTHTAAIKALDGTATTLTHMSQEAGSSTFTTSNIVLDDEQAVLSISSGDETGSGILATPAGVTILATDGASNSSSTIELTPAGIAISGNISGTSNLEVNTNKVTSISSGSTNTQYPSAKCVYDLVGNIETLLQALR